MLLAILLWLALAVVAVTNGYIGNTWVLFQFGETWVEPYKVAVIVTAIFLASWFYIRQRRETPWAKAAMVASITWVFLTVLFEFVFGHYIMGNSWESLLEAYQIWNGHLWMLVLLAESIAPFVIGWRFSMKREQ
ncbi:MAG: hypothetical protein J7641_22280 [Cyanobacteria bacterium SID2]|nr:hypothetical protein [Cyanobacteria bacterium SID2]MBP0004490.1 hypothetical protein [Cyanobacteria bacterium SBC]